MDKPMYERYELGVYRAPAVTIINVVLVKTERIYTNAVWVEAMRERR